MKVVDFSDFEAISPIFKGEAGHRRAERIMKMLSIDKVNNVHEKFFNYSGSEFTSRLLEDIGVDYMIGNAERLKDLPPGAFVTISNHPYGGLDGIISIDLIARIRPDYKFIVNEILSRILTLRDNFLTVTPVGNKKHGITSASLKGIREAILHIKQGHPIGLFPSGAVSDFRLRNMKVRDRKWQKSILHLIHHVNLPVLPMRFFDMNSPFFYFLGLINWRIRLLRQPSEVFNKKNTLTRIGIGNIISPDEQERYKDPVSLGKFLREAVYTLPMPSEFISSKEMNLTQNKGNNISESTPENYENK